MLLFICHAEFKLPAGSQLPDGKLVPEDAVPQPDGSVALADGTVILPDEITLPDGLKLSAVLSSSGEIPAPAASMPDGSQPAKLGEWRLSPDFQASVPSFSWPIGFKLPQGSQLADGNPIPEGVVPDADGKVTLSDGTVSYPDDITLPDGLRLSAVLKPSAEEATPAKSMPDGSIPAQLGAWRLPQFSMPEMPKITWPEGFKLPQGSQLPDGKPVPEDAAPQTDGSLQLADGTIIVPEDVTLPDGVKLSSALNPSEKSPTPATTMPDGSKPSASIQWRFTKTSFPDMTAVSWPAGLNIPAGSKLPDGTTVPLGALPQPDGTVTLPDGTQILAEDVSLPDGKTLAALLKPLRKPVEPSLKDETDSKPPKSSTSIKGEKQSKPAKKSSPPGSPRPGVFGAIAGAFEALSGGKLSDKEPQEDKIAGT